jgi:hypothetical protein
VREAITNAVTHADYSQRGAPVRALVSDIVVVEAGQNSASPAPKKPTATRHAAALRLRTKIVFSGRIRQISPVITSMSPAYGTTLDSWRGE